MVDIILPARYESKRLPGKLLKSCGGKPLLYWTWRVADVVASLHPGDRAFIATDSTKIAEAANAFGATVVMTGDHPCGTDRVAEAADKIGGKSIVINLQADSVCVDPLHLRALIKYFAHPIVAADMATIVYPLSYEHASATNVVKAIVAGDRVLYFSRERVPHHDPSRGEPPPEYYGHLGVYAYTRAALATFAAMPQHPLEKTESLEQLRYLSLGLPIHAIIDREFTKQVYQVDTERDLARFIGDIDKRRQRGCIL